MRIEDVDAPRTVPGAAEEILARLAHFGMFSDAPPVWQSARDGAYAVVFEQLVAEGSSFIRAAARAVKSRMRSCMRTRGIRRSLILAHVVMTRML